MGQEIKGLDFPIVLDLASVSVQDKLQLQQVALTVTIKPKVSLQIMASTVINLFQNQYITLKVLSELLNRSEDYLRLKVLNPMVKSGQLVRAFPAKPNDPRQAYRAVDNSLRQ